MAGITLRTARQVVPMIYAYTTPEIARHNGWTKIGYTEQSVDKRLKQQTHTADVLYHEEWRGNAVYDDGSGEVFTDHDFHAYLRKLNVENDRKNEWFHLDGQQSRRYFQDFRIYFKFNIRTVCRFLRLRRRKKAVVVDGLLINIVKKRNSWNAFVGITNEFIIADTFLNRGSIFVGCIMFYKAFDVVT